MRKHCVFCGSHEKMTREHVVPEWLEGVIDRPEGFILTHFGSHHPTRSRRTGKLDVVARQVCEPCNVTWMSALESACSPLLTPMIRGQSRNLSEQDQRLIASWSYKTALMFSFTAAGGALPAGHYQRFFAEREPPPTTAVRLGAYVGSDRWVMWVFRQGLVRGKPNPGVLEQRPDGYCTTFIFGHLVVQVLDHFFPQNRSSEDLAVTRAIFTEVWPASGSVQSWPPTYIMDDGLAQAVAKVISPHAFAWQWKPLSTEKG